MLKNEETIVTTVLDGGENSKDTYHTVISYSGKGGAIYNNNAKLNISNAKFTSNKAGESGGAIYNAVTSPLNIKNSEFKSNSSLNKITTKEYTVNTTTGKKSKTITTSVYDENGKGGAIYSNGI